MVCTTPADVEKLGSLLLREVKAADVTGAPTLMHLIRKLQVNCAAGCHATEKPSLAQCPQTWLKQAGQHRHNNSQLLRAMMCILVLKMAEKSGHPCLLRSGLSGRL